LAIFVLVHGGFHGSWCWDKVTPILKKEGHSVETPDLPGHGMDKTPIQEVTLQSCVTKVCRIIERKPGPVILVGHSLSGLVISQVAEQIPDRIKTLVYLTAFLLKDGESLQPIFESFRPFHNTSQDQSHHTIKDDVVASLFYNDCSTDDIAKAKALLGPEASALLKTPLLISNKKFGRIPRIFIECLNDKTLVPEYQKKMYTASPCLKVFSLNTGHSPFLSAPEELAHCLISIAESNNEQF
jgi:pimeloyl-ACP methyl ester carboxylesterase